MEYFYDRWVRQMCASKRIGCYPVGVVAYAWNPAINTANYSYSSHASTDNREAHRNGVNPAVSEVCLSKTSHVGVLGSVWYAEVQPSFFIGGETVYVGVAKASVTLGDFLGSDAGGWGFQQTGDKAHGGVVAAYGAPYTNGQTIGVLVDFDNDELSFSIDGVSQGVAYTGINTSTIYIAASIDQEFDVFLIATTLADMQFFPGGTVKPWL